MAAGQYDFLCEQGATFSRRITWTDENGDVVPLTGYSARMKVRTTIDAATLLHELTTDNGGISLGGVAGTIDLLIDAATTADFPAGTRRSGIRYYYDLELESSTGYVTRLLQGRFTVSPEVTRP